MNSFPGLWTLFAMLATSAILVCILWYRLGGSADYENRKGVKKAADDVEPNHVHATPEPMVLQPMAELTESSSRVHPNNATKV